MLMAIFESVGSKLNKTGGVLLWKLNAAFPSVIWQIYDWYLNPNAGYYFTKRAVEPLHVQLNLDDSTAAVVNREYQDRNGLTLEATMYNADMKKISEQSVSVNAPAEQATEVQSLAPDLDPRNELTFVELTLQNSNGKTVSNNLYWFAPDDDFSRMQSLPKSELTVSDISPVNGKEQTWEITYENTTDRLAFFINTQVTNKEGKEVLPSYWADNYIWVQPGTSKTVEVSIRDAEFSGGPLYLVLKGLNVDRQKVLLNHK